MDSAETELLGAGNDTSHPSTSHNIVIARRAHTQDEYDNRYPNDVKPNPPLSERIKRKFSRQCLTNNLLSYLPIIGFVRTYKPKEYILGDILSGLTVGFMALPMALGHGVLSGLKPIHGLYTSLFPTVVYMIFGTSPYVSFGTNAVLALVTFNVIEREAGAFVVERESANLTAPTEEEILAVKVGSSMACCFIAGLILMGMGLLKLGVITTYLSVSFVGGFTTAAAVHIASSQVPKMFGIKINTSSGAGNLIFMYINLFEEIATTNVADLVLCIFCIAVLLLVKICINERYASKMKVPIPIDLILVIVVTSISHFAKFDERFNVNVAGRIPSGFQSPKLPPLERTGHIVTDAFVIAILSLMMTISMAKMCGQINNKPIDDNQELVAYGASNVISSFFFCFPSATGPPRSMLLSSLGARTTLCNITTAVFILLVIVAVGHLFVSLPLSVLGAMISVSTKDLILQYRNLPRIWRVNKCDFVIWVVTNSVSILVDLNYGILAGIGISVYLVVLKDQSSSGRILSVAKDEDIIIKFRGDTNVERKLMNGIRIFRIPTSFHFATAERIMSQLYNMVLNPKKTDTAENYESDLEVEQLKSSDKGQTNGNIVNSKVNIEGTHADSDIHSVILDCSAVCYIDMTGLGTLKLITSEYERLNVSVYLTCVSHDVMRTLTLGEFFQTFNRERVLLDIFDALYVINNEKKTFKSVIKLTDNITEII